MRANLRVSVLASRLWSTWAVLQVLVLALCPLSTARAMAAPTGSAGAPAGVPKSIARPTEASQVKAESPPATTPTGASALPVTNTANQAVEQKWGIRIYGPFLSGGGNIVDFRYKILDPAKAVAVTKRENKPSLINQATGAKLIIPNTPKLGTLRQATRHPEKGKVYFMLFANTRHHVKHGDKVTIIAGECKLENLTVE